MAFLAGSLLWGLVVTEFKEIRFLHISTISLYIITFCPQHIIYFIAMIVVITWLQIGTNFADFLVVRFSCLLWFGSRKYMQPGWNEVDIIPCVMMWTLEDKSLYLRRLFLPITSFCAQIAVLGNWFIPVLCKCYCEIFRGLLKWIVHLHYHAWKKYFHIN